MSDPERGTGPDGARTPGGVAGYDGETHPSAVRRTVAAALHQPLLAALLALALVVAGVYSFRRLPVGAYPDISPPEVEIITQWPGQGAEEVERLITVPVETAMNGIPGLAVQRSISLYGLSDVRLTFRNGTDNYFAREQVFERLPGSSLASVNTISGIGHVALAA